MAKLYRMVKICSITGAILLVTVLFLSTFSITVFAASLDNLDIGALLEKNRNATSGANSPGSGAQQPSGGARATGEELRLQEQADALRKKRNELSKIENEYQKRIQRGSFLGKSKDSGHAISLETMFGDEPVVSFDLQDPLTGQIVGDTPPTPPATPMAGKGAQDGAADLPNQGEASQVASVAQAKAATSGSGRTLMKQKYVRLILMKNTIQKQLSDLMAIKSDAKADAKNMLAEDKDLSALKAKLQKQLVAITELEAKYNDNDFIDLNDEVAKTIKNTLAHDPVSQKVFRGAKPISVSEKVFQFGYQFFYGNHVPPGFHTMPIANNYIVGPGDELRIVFYGSIQDEKVVMVDREGTINLFNNAPVKVGGLTFAEVDAKLQKIIKEKMIGVSARLTMSNFRSMRIFMLGDVSIPGPCMVGGMSTVSSALHSCGGVDKVGSLRKIAVIRDGKKIGTFDLYDFLLKGNTSRDPVLMEGDAVFVSSIQNTTAIAGEVNRPAIYEFSENMTLDEAIGTAGGARPTSLTQLAQIERIDKEGNITTIDVDLAGPSRKMALHDGDIVKIFSTIDDGLNANAVYFIGNVRNAGKRSFQPGMKVADLLDDGKALMPDTYLEYGIIERESGMGRETAVLHFNPGKAISGKEGENPALLPRDRIYLFNSNEFVEPESVSVEGFVNAPGRYALKKNMVVVDALLAAGGLSEEADLTFAELYREDSVTKASTMIPLNLDATIAMRGEADNPSLHNNDRLVVHSIWERLRKSSVTISGEIKKPAAYPLVADARLLDLIYAAGGLTEKAYKKKVEVTRYEVRDGSEMESTHFEVNLEEALRGSAKDNVLLKANDQVIIRPISNWGETAYVKLEGEIKFPGKYIIQKGETLSSVVKRAGGFSGEAFVYGLRFTRTSIAEMQKKQYMEMADRLDQETNHLALTPTQIGADKSAEAKQMMIAGLKAMADKLRKTEGTGRLVVNIPADLAKIAKEEDLELENGDAMYVPKIPVAVLVTGAVHNQNAFQYRKTASVETYINMAGGYTDRANAEGTNIMKANGEVMPLRGGYFLKRASLGPGDVIMVPETVTQYSNLQMTQDITTILYQLSLTAAGLKTIGIFQ